MTARAGPPVRLTTLVLAAVIGLAACGSIDPETGPTATAGRSAAPPAVGPASAAARAALFDAFGEARLVVAESPIPYRPAEAAALAVAPRTVYQVTLPAEPSPAFVVVYELPSEAAAVAAAKEQHAYLVSGPGKVQAPLGTDHVLQQLGSTVLYYQWLPPAAVDPSTPRVAEALRTVGTTFEVGD